MKSVFFVKKTNVDHVYKNVILLTLVIFLCIPLNGCIKNTNVPEYLKSVVAYKEGDGIVVYFVLADANGQMTAADGAYDLTISQDASSYSSDNTSEESIKLKYIHSETTINDFKNTEIGLGAFAREALVYPVGRIRYSEFVRQPEEDGRGKIEIEFRQNGKPPLTGSTSIYF